MRPINLQTWPRREHFEFFRRFDHPHFSMCTNVEVTELFKEVKRRDVKFTVAVCYVLARAANAIPEFRYRLRINEVVEHEVVHPAVTILSAEEIFGFCAIDYHHDFKEFADGAAERIANAREQPTLSNGPGRDDYLFMTAIPWVSFTNFSHPIHLNPADSVPRFAWGKVFEEGERLKMPLDVQVHHALRDGRHIGRYYARVEELFSCPGFLRDTK